MSNQCHDMLLCHTGVIPYITVLCVYHYLSATPPQPGQVNTTDSLWWHGVFAYSTQYPTIVYGSTSVWFDIGLLPRYFPNGHAGGSPSVAWWLWQQKEASRGSREPLAGRTQPRKKKVGKMCMGAVFGPHLTVSSELLWLQSKARVKSMKIDNC